MTATSAHVPQGKGPTIMASMLTADLARLGAECHALASAGVDGIHWDIMDGIAVPSLSFGPETVLACRRMSDLPFEVHVMSRAPEGMIDTLAEAGCSSLTIHPDWVSHPRRLLARIADTGMIPGVALSPGTPVEYAQWHLDIARHVLVMTVEPGFGGQAHISSMSHKVERLRALADQADHAITVEVDGGIDHTTIGPMAQAGATAFVVGSALWRASSYAEAVAALHEIHQQVYAAPDHPGAAPDQKKRDKT